MTQLNEEIDPVKAWNIVWNLDETLRPWEDLHPRERKAWCLYVASGAYAAARAKVAIDVD